MPIAVGVFDHMDSGGRPPHEIYEERLKLIEAYDAAGFYGYHVAEHHQTSLGIAPSPGIFLAAAAARTKQIKLGPLVYIVPTYPPLRLIEEICMLDHLTKGRYQFGMGRGVSPFEIAFHGVSHLEAAAMYREAIEIVLKGLTSETLSHRGEYWRYTDVPMIMRPYQQPHPPLWYGVSRVASVQAPADNKVNIVVNAPRTVAKEINAAYLEAYRRKHGAVGAPFMGMVRHVFVAETDAKARELAAGAYRKWKLSHVELWRKFGAENRLWPEQLDEAIDKDAAFVGSPATVRDFIDGAMAESGCNYLVGRFCFGDMPYETARRSVEMFIAEVLPKLK